MITEEEIGVKKSQAEECLELPEAQRKQRKDGSRRLQRQHSPASTLISGF